MVARFDKYDPISGGFRAELAADFTNTALHDIVLGTGINAAGKCVPHGAGQTDLVGVVIVDRTKRKAGNIQDIMTAGEIVGNPLTLSDKATPLVAGTVYYLDADGDLTVTPGRYRVGHTVEAWRLIVRWQDLGLDIS